MAQINHKELLLLQDNISMCQNTVEILQSCINTTNDAQLKNMCNQMVQDHKQDAQRLAKHITQTNMQ